MEWKRTDVFASVLFASAFSDYDVTEEYYEEYYESSCVVYNSDPEGRVFE